MFGFLFRRKNSTEKTPSSPKIKSKESPTLTTLALESPEVGLLDSPNNIPGSSKSNLIPSRTDQDSFKVEALKLSDSNSDINSDAQPLNENQCLLLPPKTRSSDPVKSENEIPFMDDIENGDGIDRKDTDINASLGRQVDMRIESNLLTEDDPDESKERLRAELDELKSKLLLKDSEIRSLQSNVYMFSTERENRISEVEGLSSQLRKLREEKELFSTAIKRQEMELENLKLKNSQLSQELLEKTESLKAIHRESISNDKRIHEAQSRIRELENQLREVRKEKDDLVAEQEAIEIERDEEMRALQNSLDLALEQRIKLQHKFDHDFQMLRNSFSSQEQQLMDDFEWKLRQIESTSKAKLREKDQQIEEKVREVRLGMEKEIMADKEKVTQEREAVEEQMRLVCHYKAYEAELIQLRGLTHEQQRALRSAARQLEHFKFNEKFFHDELRSARLLLEKEKGHIQLVQTTNQRKLESQEENLHSKFEKQKNELNSKWEDRMRAECSRLRQDLCHLHAEEKHLAVESMKLQKDQEFASARTSWEKEKQDLLQNISKLKDALTEKDTTTHEEIENITAAADREKWELRKKLDKAVAIHEERYEKLKEAHVLEIDALEARYEDLLKRFKVAVQKVREVEGAGKNPESIQPIPNPKDTQSRDLAPLMILSPVNQSDSGCGDEASSEESEEDADESEEEDAEESEEEEVEDPVKKDVKESTSPISHEKQEPSVHNLREEVASLQGSIEKLTTELTVQDNGNDCETSSDETESEEYEEITDSD